MFIFISWIQEVILTLFVVQLFYSMRQCNFRNESLLLQGVVPKNKFAQRKQKNPAAKISRTTPLLRTNAALVIYIYIYIYIYSLKESEDGQLLTIKKLKNLIKNKNVSVLDLHQLHEKLNLSNLPK